jgi:NAD+ synthase
MSNFDVKKATNDCIQWIKDFFEKNGKDCMAVVGISGGKDSSVVAALCVEALGKDRVIGVLMPNGHQSDITDAYKLCKLLNIKSIEVNIKETVDSVYDAIRYGVYDNTRQGFDELNISVQSRINLPPRIRMATLYAISQSINGRVANTCNLSETLLSWETRWGDAVGDFAPISDLTVEEVKAIGYELGLPNELIEKIPSDGLCGSTDEDALGFKYSVMDRYIRTGEIDDKDIKKKIDNRVENIGLRECLFLIIKQVWKDM